MPIPCLCCKNHTSKKRAMVEAGGAGRDRTGDLLNANQALSQLSYSPLERNFFEASWMQRPGEPAPGRFRKSRSSPSGDPKRAHQTGRNRPGGCGVERLSITRFALYTQARLAFVDSTHGLS